MHRAASRQPRSVRLRKVLGALPYDVGGPSGGPSIISAGDIVMKGMTGDAQNKPFVAYRLSFDGPDKVVGKEVWRPPRICTASAIWP
jgi:hypothetical protein